MNTTTYTTIEAGRTQTETAERVHAYLVDHMDDLLPDKDISVGIILTTPGQPEAALYIQDFTMFTLSVFPASADAHAKDLQWAPRTSDRSIGLGVGPIHQKDLTDPAERAANIRLLRIAIGRATRYARKTAARLAEMDCPDPVLYARQNNGGASVNESAVCVSCSNDRSVLDASRDAWAAAEDVDPETTKDDLHGVDNPDARCIGCAATTTPDLRTLVPTEDAA